MRIFFAVPRAAWVQINLRQSLEAMGHELIAFTFPGWPDDADIDWAQRGKPSTNERLLRSFHQALEHGGLDLLFGYFYSSVVYPHTVETLRRSGVPTVNFSCNNVHQFELVQDIAPLFDFCVVPEAAAVEKFRTVGATPLRIQLAANPVAYYPQPVPREFDITFVGQRYADRSDYLDYLFQSGMAVRAWGAGWQQRKKLDLATAKAALALFEDERAEGLMRVLRNRLGRREVKESMGGPPPRILPQVPVPYGGPRLLQNDLVRMFSRSRISLGFATAGDSHLGATRLTHLRLREFEAPMSGALYLTERQAELDEYFDVGKEILTYGSPDEMLDVCRYYLAHSEEAEAIRRAGYHRSLRQHTWQHRFHQLFEILGLEGR